MIPLLGYIVGAYAIVRLIQAPFQLPETTNRGWGRFRFLVVLGTSAIGVLIVGGLLNDLYTASRSPSSGGLVEEFFRHPARTNPSTEPRIPPSPPAAPAPAEPMVATFEPGDRCQMTNATLDIFTDRSNRSMFYIALDPPAWPELCSYAERAEEQGLRELWRREKVTKVGGGPVVVVEEFRPSKYRAYKVQLQEGPYHGREAVVAASYLVK